MTAADRYRGALVGAVVGDALGAPLEGHRGPVPPQRLAYLDGDDGHALGYTDDTVMTMAVAESLLDCARLDQDRLARRFAAAFEREPGRGYGAGTAHLLRRLSAGARWQVEAPAQFGGAGSFGNGAAMRVAPVALHAAGDLLSAADLARRSAAVTHTHAAAVEGAAAQAVAVALALAGLGDVPIDRHGFLDSVLGAVTPGATADGLRRVRALLDEEAELRPGVVAREVGTGVAASESVPAAVAAFAARPDSFAETVRFAVSLGGDTDTIASMAGAVAGAYHGATGVPRAWIRRVEGVARMMELGTLLHRAALASGHVLDR